MNICHVCTWNDDRATFRYRVGIPAPELWTLGHAVHVNDAPMEGATNVWHKHGKYLPWDLFEPGRDAFDVTDDHFAGDKRKHYTDICEKARIVTTSSPAMADRIKVETGRDALYIPDALEFPIIAHEWHGGRSCMWFGHGANFATLASVKIDCPLEIVTNCSRPGSRTNVRMTPWSHNAMLRAFKRHDIVIIPQGKDAKSQAKGNNRAVNALAQGKFVVAHPTPSHKELEDFIYVTDDILEGIQWGRAHPENVAVMVAAGQVYAAWRYSASASASAWADALEN